MIEYSKDRASTLAHKIYQLIVVNVIIQIFRFVNWLYDTVDR